MVCQRIFLHYSSDVEENLSDAFIFVGLDILNLQAF